MRCRVHPYHVIRINKMLSCAGADRLQQGMRQAYGKNYGKAAQCNIGQILFSIRCNAQHVKFAMEALKRAKMKFAGRQRVVQSNKFGFTKLSRPQFANLDKKKLLVRDGSNVKIINKHGPLSRLPLFK